MPKILAIDTSTDACSAALLLDHEIFDRFMVAPKEHTSFILAMVDELLSESKVGFGELDAIAFGCGPGSFTGVRLASSIAQGFAFASVLPVVRISTLRALAQEIFVEYKIPKVLVAQDARMQEIYFGEYCVDDNGVMRGIKPDILANPYELANAIVVDDDVVGVGDGFEIYSEIFSRSCKRFISRRYVQAKYVAKLAADDFMKGLAVSAEQAQPAYLREKVAWA